MQHEDINQQKSNYDDYESYIPTEEENKFDAERMKSKFSGFLNKKKKKKGPTADDLLTGNLQPGDVPLGTIYTEREYDTAGKSDNDRLDFIKEFIFSLILGYWRSIENHCTKIILLGREDMLRTVKLAMMIDTGFLFYNIFIDTFLEKFTLNSFIVPVIPLIIMGLLYAFISTSNHPIFEYKIDYDGEIKEKQQGLSNMVDLSKKLEEIEVEDDIEIKIMTPEELQESNEVKLATARDINEVKEIAMDNPDDLFVGIEDIVVQDELNKDNQHTLEELMQGGEEFNFEVLDNDDVMAEFDALDDEFLGF